MLHIIKDLKSCLDTEYELNGEKYIRSVNSHILYIYAHGSDKNSVWNIFKYFIEFYIINGYRTFYIFRCNKGFG